MLNRVTTLLAGLFLLSCDGGEKKDGLTLGAGAGGEDCALTFETLPNTEWLYLDVKPDKSEAPSHTKGRLKFVKDGDKLVAKYNVGSLSNIYDYVCETQGEELACKQRLGEGEVELWCKAFLANGEDCTLATFQKEAPELTEEDLKEGVKKAKAEQAQAKKANAEDRFKAKYNTLGAKLRGILYVKIEKRKCRVRVTDMYKTYYNKKWIEDSNPNGINPFVKNEMGELMFEDCTNPLDLVDLTSAEFPKDPANVKNITQHKPGTEVHYWYLSGDWQKPEENCTYTFDVWKDSKPHKQGQTPETVDVRGGKALRWHFSEKYDAPSAPGQAEVMTLVAKKACQGKDPVTEVSCNAVVIKP